MNQISSIHSARAAAPFKKSLFCLAAVPALIGVLAVSACGGNNSTPPLFGNTRIVNGMTDSSGLSASINNVPTFSGINFGSASGIRTEPEGNYKVQVSSASTANSSGNVTFTVDNVTISNDKMATVLTYGVLNSSTQNGFTASQSLNSPASGNFGIQPLHAAYSASLANPTLSFYLVAPGGSIIGATPISAPFAQSTALATLARGNYEIIVTNGTRTVFDSGPRGITLPPATTNVLQLAALDAPGQPNGASISLLLLDNGGGVTPLLNGAN